MTTPPHLNTVSAGRRNHDPQYAPARLRRPPLRLTAYLSCLFAGAATLAGLFYAVCLSIAWAER